MVGGAVRPPSEVLVGEGIREAGVENSSVASAIAAVLRPVIADTPALAPTYIVG